MLLPLELSSEPGNLSNPRSPEQTCDPEGKHRLSFHPRRVTWQDGHIGSMAPYAYHVNAQTAAVQARWGGAWRPEGMCAPHGIPRLCASSQLLPTYLSLNCLEGTLMTALPHVSTTQSGGSQTSFNPEMPVILPINQR